MSDMNSLPSESTVQTVLLDDADAGLRLPPDRLEMELFYSSSFCTCATCSQSSTARSDLSWMVSVVALDSYLLTVAYLEEMHVQVPVCIGRVEQQSAVFGLCAF